MPDMPSIALQFKDLISTILKQHRKWTPPQEMEEIKDCSEFSDYFDEKEEDMCESFPAKAEQLPHAEPFSTESVSFATNICFSTEQKKEGDRDSDSDSESKDSSEYSEIAGDKEKLEKTLTALNKCLEIASANIPDNPELHKLLWEIEKSCIADEPILTNLHSQDESKGTIKITTFKTLSQKNSRNPLAQQRRSITIV